MAGSALCAMVANAPNQSRRSNDPGVQILKKECKALREGLRRAYGGERMRAVVDLSGAAGGGRGDKGAGSIADVCQGFTVMENRAYSAGRRGAQDVDAWMRGDDRRKKRRIVSPDNNAGKA